MKNRKELEQKRKLTAAEQERSQRFEALKAKLEEEGYVAHDLTVGMVYANVMAIVLGIPLVIPLWIAFGMRNPGLSGTFTPVGSLLFLIAFAALIVVHEWIHGISWSMFTKEGWKSISFGFIRQYFTPYCTCNEPLKKGQYIFGGLMPTVLLGLFPSVVAIFSGFAALFTLGTIMIFCGGGDLTIVLKLLRYRGGSDTVYVDHPFMGGLVAFDKEDMP